jgi:hypothetical protein
MQVGNALQLVALLVNTHTYVTTPAALKDWYVLYRNDLLYYFDPA